MTVARACSISLGKCSNLPTLIDGLSIVVFLRTLSSHGKKIWMNSEKLRAPFASLSKNCTRFTASDSRTWKIPWSLRKLMISTGATLLSPSLSNLSNAALRAKSLMLDSLYLAISKSFSPSPTAIKRCLSFYSEIKLSIFCV